MKNKNTWAYLWQNTESGIIKLYRSATELQKAQGISSYSLQDLVWMKSQTIRLSDDIEVHKVPITDRTF